MKFHIYAFLILFLCAFFFAPSADAATIGKPMQSLGLVGYWSFDVGKGGAKAVDMSGRGNNGTLTNMNTTAAWVGGKIGNALDFDGVNDSVNISTFSSTNKTYAFAFWIKLGSTGNNINYVFDSQSGRLVINFGRFAPTSGALSFYDGSYKSLGSAITVGVWHHVVLVLYNMGGVATGYVDGVQVGTAAYTGTNIGGTTRIGTNFDGINYPFDGSLDDFRVYNRALSPEEIKRLYRQTSPQFNASQANKLRQGLVGMWTFDGNDMSGNTAIDRSGNGNNGTLTNGPAPAIGKIGQALNFDGSNDYVGIANAVNTSITSVSAWVKVPPNTSSITGRLFHRNQTNDFILAVDGDATANPRAVSVGITGSIDRRTSANVLMTDVWHHVVATYNNSGASSGINIYVDGVNQSLTDVAAFAFGDTQTTIGSDIVSGAPTRLFIGLIDEVRVYNRALTEAEIRQLYKAGSSVHPNLTNKTNLRDGLVGHWSFDGNDMSTTSASDISGNGNTGWLPNRPQKVIGQIGQALNFDGVDDYVN